MIVVVVTLPGVGRWVGGGITSALGNDTPGAKLAEALVGFVSPQTTTVSIFSCQQVDIFFFLVFSDFVEAPPRKKTKKHTHYSTRSSESHTGAIHGRK